jgi:hypothetical protein
VGNDAPTVEITSPASGAELFARSTIWAQARVYDANDNLDDVYWQLFDGILPTGWTATGPSVAIPYDHLAPGRYSLVATAYDTEGERAQDTVTLNIQAANGGPSIDLVEVSPLVSQEYDSGDVLFTDSCPVDVSGDRRIDHSDLCRGIHFRVYASDDRDPTSALTYRWTVRNDAGVVETQDTTVPSFVYYFPLGEHAVDVVAFDSAGTAGNAATETIQVTTLF